MKNIISHILDAIAKGEDGSVHLHTGTTPAKGYMVGGRSWTLTTTYIDSYTLEDFIKPHQHVLALPNVYIGWWRHQGRIYLDVSDNVQVHDVALKLGRVRNEKAIFSLNTMQEVPCQ